MGSHADAVLAYGYNLGGGEKWEVAEADDDNGLVLPWFSDYEGDGENGNEGFEEAATARLLASIDFADRRPDEDYGTFRDRLNAAMARLGVRITSCYCYEFPTYLLTAEVFEADSGNVQALDLPDLARRPETGGWDEKLRAALTVLGLTPTRRQPNWLLTATYG
ncbi:hypothetical protein ACIBSV_46950 [Embleya sp. NPDC050154]|uniref:hypothetical protein n=1 Tax=Embleya sp. NPDC050154 TaxID=3363988 RepID=UPI0037A00C0D